MAKEPPSYRSNRIAVPKQFKAVFSHFYSAENEGTQSVTKTFLPTYQTILVFNFGASVRLQTPANHEIKIDRCVALGIIKKAFAYTLPVGSKILVANFKADAFYRFFGKALAVENFTLHPDELVEDDCFSVLWNHLKALKDPEKQVEYILDFCTPYLTAPHELTKALAQIENAGINPIQSIAETKNQSERNIQLQHRKIYGYSAKEINRYQRFLQAIELLQKQVSNTDKVDWLAIVERCGYYDQPQLIRDFNYFLHLSPTKYLKFQQDICMAHS